MMRRVCVFGKESLLNQLLADLLKKRLTPRCVLIDSLEAAQERDLLLINDSEQALQEQEEQPRGTIALFNVATDHDICREVSLGLIKGVFYVDDPVEHMLKGIQALLEGQIWIPRQVLADAAMARKRLEEQEKLLLTRREMEILMQASTGATNDEIAQKLFISAFTVKTHLYNIYKKIGVSNRLSAARWTISHSDAFVLNRLPEAPSAQARELVSIA